MLIVQAFGTGQPAYRALAGPALVMGFRSYLDNGDAAETPATGDGLSALYARGRMDAGPLYRRGALSAASVSTRGRISAAPIYRRSGKFGDT